MTNWKNAERTAVEAFNKAGLTAKRISRGSNFSESTYDLKIFEYPNLKIDVKYRTTQPFRHHGLLKEIKAKYCKEKEDQAILITKNYKESGAIVSMDLDYFAQLLQSNHNLSFVLLQKEKNKKTLDQILEDLKIFFEKD